MSNDIKVLLVEDHTMIRMGTALVIEKTDGISMVAEAEDGQQGVDMAKKFLPDVILMDIGLPVMDGIAATRHIKDMNLDSKILIFTSRDNDDDVFAALAAGADGYIMKGATPEQLTAAIFAVNEGTAWLDPAIARLVLSNVQKQKTDEIVTENSSCKAAKNTFGLTERELEVLSLIVDGLSNPEIADKLFITRATAKAHVHSILQKLYVNDRTQAAVTAMREGLVSMLKAFRCLILALCFCVVSFLPSYSFDAQKNVYSHFFWTKSYKEKHKPPVNNMPKTMQDYYRQLNKNASANQDIPAPKFEKDSKLVDLPDPTLTLRKYNNPPGM